MLKPKQIKAIDALLTSVTQKEAAIKAGIGEDTLSEYMRNSEFREEYRKRYSDSLDDAARGMRSTLSEAIQCLLDVVRKDDASDRDKITAARTLIDYTMQLAELCDIIRICSPLEEAGE